MAAEPFKTDDIVLKRKFTKIHVIVPYGLSELWKSCPSFLARLAKATAVPIPSHWVVSHVTGENLRDLHCRDGAYFCENQEISRDCLFQIF